MVSVAQRLSMLSGSPLDNWLWHFGEGLLDSAAFRSVLHFVEANAVPGGGGPAAAMRFLKDRTIRLNDAAMRRKCSDADPALQHLLVFAALLDHRSPRVASAALAALASCLQPGNRRQSHLLITLAAPLGAALRRPGLMRAAAVASAAAASDAGADPAAVIVLHAAHALVGTLESKHSPLDMQQIIAGLAPGAIPAAHLAANMAAGRAAQASAAAAATPEIAAETVMSLASAGALLAAVQSHARTAPHTEVLGAALALLQQMTLVLRQANPGIVAQNEQLQAVLVTCMEHTMHAADRAAAALAAVSLIGSSSNPQVTPSTAVRAGAIAPELAAKALRLVGEMCATAVGCGMERGERLLQRVTSGRLLLRAALAGARNAAKWRLARCVARLAQPEVLQLLPQRTVMLLAGVLAETHAAVRFGVAPKSLTMAEVAAARHERLAAPAALLFHCCTALQTAVWTDGSGEELPEGSKTVQQQHGVCMAAAAALHMTAAAVLQSVGNPALLQFSGGGSGSDGSEGGCGRRQREPSSGSGTAAASADGDATVGSAPARGSGGSTVADSAGRGSQTASHCAELTAAGIPSQPEQAPLGAASLALADSGALAPLAATLRLPPRTQAHLLSIADAWAESVPFGDCRPNAVHAAACNALAGAAGLLEAEVAAGWVPPAAVVVAHVQAAAGMLGYFRSIMFRSRDFEAALRNVTTACDLLTGLAAHPASGKAARAAVAVEWLLVPTISTVLVALVVEKETASPQRSGLLVDALWLLAASAAGTTKARQLLAPGEPDPANDRMPWARTAKMLRHTLGKSRFREEMQWVDAAMRGVAPPPPKWQPRPDPATESAASPGESPATDAAAAAAAAADAAMQALLQEEESSGAAASGQPKSRTARAQKKVGMAAAKAVAR